MYLQEAGTAPMNSDRTRSIHRLYKKRKKHQSTTGSALPPRIRTHRSLLWHDDRARYREPRRNRDLFHVVLVAALTGIRTVTFVEMLSSVAREQVLAMSSLSIAFVEVLATISREEVLAISRVSISIARIHGAIISIDWQTTGFAIWHCTNRWLRAGRDGNNDYSRRRCGCGRSRH
jgi:hypothetical protein